MVRIKQLAVLRHAYRFPVVAFHVEAVRGARYGLHVGIIDLERFP